MNECKDGITKRRRSRLPVHTVGYPHRSLAFVGDCAHHNHDRTLRLRSFSTVALHAWSPTAGSTHADVAGGPRTRTVGQRVAGPLESESPAEVAVPVGLKVLAVSFYGTGGLAHPTLTSCRRHSWPVLARHAHLDI